MLGAVLQLTDDRTRVFHTRMKNRP
jgi:hypothetical protein